MNRFAAILYPFTLPDLSTCSDWRKSGEFFVGRFLLTFPLCGEFTLYLSERLMSSDNRCETSEAALEALAKEEEMERRGDEASVWGALAAVGIGIAGSWC